MQKFDQIYKKKNHHKIRQKMTFNTYLTQKVYNPRIPGHRKKRKINNRENTKSKYKKKKKNS